MSIFKKENLPLMEEKEVAREKHTIMVVDDDEEQLKSIKKLLSGDYNVITFPGGQEALDHINVMENPGSISLIISDQRMPNLTGIDLFERLLSIVPNTIRIILTGYTDIPDIIASINRAKIYKFIQKPVEPEDLKITVQRAIDMFELQRERDEKNQELKRKNNELNEANRKLKKANKINKELSLTDPLTKLRNRRYLNEIVKVDILRLDREFETWKRETDCKEPLNTGLTFMMLDLDHFKEINDEYGGHTVGDKVLKQFADILRKTCRDYDILVRWGGEEFLVVSQFNSRDEIWKLAERLREAVETDDFGLRDKNSKKKNITCSIGIASYPFLPAHPRAIDWEKVVDIADIALYAAKNSGRNCCIGIMGTDKTNPDDLMRPIDENVEQLLQNGELLTYSTGQKPIKWH